MSPRRRRKPRSRPLIAFFGHADVFEDFYPHYGVSQSDFVSHWDGSGNHRLLRLLQDELGDVLWFELSIAPRVAEATHSTVGCRVRMVRSSILHRLLWHFFYASTWSWRLRRFHKAYATAASYLSILSWPLLRSLFVERPNAIFAQDYSTGRIDVLLVLSRLLGVPLIAYHAGSTPDHFVGMPVRRLSLPRIDRLIASSRREAQSLIKNFGVPESHIRVVLTPVDIERYRSVDRDESCRKEGLSSSVRYLLFIGRLEDRIKRVSVLIDAFARIKDRHPETELLIAGEGQDMDTLRRLAEQRCPGRVRFLGWIKDVERLVRLYNAAECLCLPSRSEGFPNVIAEALASGTPVIASDVGGINELVVPGETGWLIPPDDGAALEKAIDHVLSEPKKLDSMRANARRLATQRVSLASVAKQLRECFLSTPGLSLQRGSPD